MTWDRETGEPGILWWDMALLLSFRLRDLCSMFRRGWRNWWHIRTWRCEAERGGRTMVTWDKHWTNNSHVMDEQWTNNHHMTDEQCVWAEEQAICLIARTTYCHPIIITYHSPHSAFLYLGPYLMQPSKTHCSTWCNPSMPDAAFSLHDQSFLIYTLYCHFRTFIPTSVKQWESQHNLV